jgi:hypothetical protein
MSRQKIPGAPRFLSSRMARPGARFDLFRRFAAASPSPVWETEAHRCSGISCHFGFHNRSIPEEDYFHV